MYETVSLTSAQKSRMQNQKQLYVLLKMINFTEKYYSYDKIDSNTYKTEINKYIEKYNRFTQVIPQYNLNSFLKKYNIPQDEISWAKLVLDKGVHTDQNQTKQNFLFMQAAVKFIEVFDTLNMNADDPNIGQIKPSLEQLAMILKRLTNRLGAQFNYKFKQFEGMLKHYVQSKTINESLTESQFKEIKLNLEGMYKMMELILKN